MHSSIPPILRPAKFSYGVLSLLPLSVGAAAGEPLAKDERPNIILFVVDDMGWQDTSLPFWRERTAQNEKFRTPNMERLATQGVKFTQAYACPVSSPSRVSLMTGMNAARHRVTNWTLERDKGTDAAHPLLEMPDWHVNGITEDPSVERATYVTTLPSLLRRAGYHTIHCGKAHLGAIDTPGEDPLNLGFEVNIAGHAAGGPTSYLSEVNYGNHTDGTPSPLFAVPGLEQYWGTGTFLTEALTREALKALERSRADGRPYFLHMSHYAVHVPFDRDMRYYDRYKSEGYSDHEAAYASLVEGMDKSLGDLLDWVEQHGDPKRSTIVIFVSDNGGFSASGYWRDEPLHTQNFPLNSGKGSVYEGGIRVPLIVSGLDLSDKGGQCDVAVMIEDLYPTILDLAGVVPHDLPQRVDGWSIAPLVSGEVSTKWAERSLYWHFPNDWGVSGPGIGTVSAVRHGEWKLVYYYDTGRKELFNLSRDIGERVDQSAKYPNIVRQLSRRLGQYLRSVGAQRPSFRSSHKLCPWPDEI